LHATAPAKLLSLPSDYIQDHRQTLRGQVLECILCTQTEGFFTHIFQTTLGSGNFYGPTGFELNPTLLHLKQIITSLCLHVERHGLQRQIPLGHRMQLGVTSQLQ
jgi:hypothetical protein